MSPTNNAARLSSSQTSDGRQPDLATIDPMWHQLRAEADASIISDPSMSHLVLTGILNQSSLEGSVVHRVASRLDHPDMPADLLRQVFKKLLKGVPGIAQAIRADMIAVYERDPACSRYIEPVLFLKGFHALTAHRFAHQLWLSGRKDVALYLQSRVSELFSVDIHPAAVIGRGVMFDHATAIVVGETAVIEDEVSVLHGVTLGGTGKVSGDRHPKVRRGVMIGAGAKILGNIEIGHCSRIAAGSVVLHAVPPCKTVAGVPAKIVGEAGCAEPSMSMNQLLETEEMLDFQI